MIVLLNPYAASGGALNKWSRFESFLRKFRKHKVIQINSDSRLSYKQIHESISCGEVEFVAAGGDGTINYLLNSIMEYPDAEVVNHIKLGAIGLGSSNDFHKPFQAMLNNIPHKLNFEEAKLRDICFIEFIHNNKMIVKYFIINASVGLTAFGNSFFNHPNKTLTILKKLFPSLAIYYAALKSIAAYKNIDAKIESSDGLRLQTKISNLGIVKSPHFSGNLSYNSIIQYDNGLFNFHLSENLTKYKSLVLLWKLGNRNAQNNLIKTWASNEISISAEQDFEVEFDGETITTNKVRCGILQKKIRVCE